MCAACGVASIAIGPERIRRVEVRFRVEGDAGGLVLEYAATESQAHHFAEAMGRRGYAVFVDENSRRGLPPLPCRMLWRYR